MANTARIQFPDLVELPENTGEVNNAGNFDPGVQQNSNFRNIPPRADRLQEKLNATMPNAPAAPASIPQSNNQTNSLNRNNSKKLILHFYRSFGTKYARIAWSK